MSYKKTVLGPAPVSEDAVSQLVMLFPALGRAEARGALSVHGSLAAAASALVDADADAANEAAAAAAEDEEAGGARGCGGEDDELPSYIRCPKCYSPDVVQECESSESLIVCLKCQHHFARARAKKGRSHGVNGGGGAREKGPRGGRRREEKPRRTRSPRHPQTVREVPLSKEALAPPPRSPVDEVGPVEKKLMENRAAAAERQMLRLVVSHAASPKEKRVLTVPRSDAYATLMKQARAKYRLRKPLKGVRLLPDSVGIPPEDVQNLQDGTEVLVTLTSDFETPHHKKKHHRHHHHDATAGADDTAGAAGLLTSPALSATSPSSQSTGSTLSSSDPAPTFEACLAAAAADATRTSPSPSSTAGPAPVSPKPLPSTHPAAAAADAAAAAPPAPAASAAGEASASDAVASALSAPQAQETSVGA